MPQIFDNINNQFSDALRSIISANGVRRADFCVGYFNLRGWDLVDKEIDKLEGEDIYEGDNDEPIHRCCRLLIGMHHTDRELIARLYSNNPEPDQKYVETCRRAIARDFHQQMLIGNPTNHDQQTLRHLSRQLKEGRVCVKLYLAEPLHAKLYIVHRSNDPCNPMPTIMGSSNLTYAGLTHQGELNAEFGDSDSAKKLSQWFNDRWDDRFCIDITDELAKIIDSGWAAEKAVPPYYIYLKTAYNLSLDAINGYKELSLPPEFQKEMLDFQKVAVSIAVKHLTNNKHFGAMIGDVVGLGKTITACAIAKIFENTYGSSTLVICPANLRTMWEGYSDRYTLNMKVESMTSHFDSKNPRYFKLVIIDESHNLRNENRRRYQNILEYLRAMRMLGTKVLLLTATPYNKDFRDLSAQLKLFVTDDEDLGIRPETYIRAIGGDRQFIHQHSDTPIRSIRAFEKSGFIEDWTELMKLFLVRRTRSFIKKHYAHTDENGRQYLLLNNNIRSYFATRIPRSIKFTTTDGDQYSHLFSQSNIDIMDNLLLPRYGLSNYKNEDLVKNAPKEIRRIFENLSYAGEQMKGFTKSTFFKRMDSCGYVFLLTLGRHLLRNMVFIYAINNNLPLPLRDENGFTDDFLDDSDGNDTSNELIKINSTKDEYEKLAKAYYERIDAKKVTFVDSKYFTGDLLNDLKTDSENLLKIAEECKQWNAADDQKLNLLYKLLTQTHPEEKVLIFSQYADTAQYLCTQLRQRGITHIDFATGNSDNPTELAQRFSPHSNQCEINRENELRVLIATDVLSEGQNLQDCRVVVNYDMPWAIVRLIQRAGRVDRIGQEAREVYCYSFFPAQGIEDVIRLRERLTDRLNENAAVVGSDEVFFEGNIQNLRDLYNEKSGILDDDNDDDVDIASMAYQIWQTAIKDNPELEKIIPNLSDGLYSTKHVDNEDSQGVITYIKTPSDHDLLTQYDKEGNIVTQSQSQILKAMACTADTQPVAMLDNHFDLVTKAIEEAETTVTASGMLGHRFSVRYRIVDILEKYKDLDNNLLFDDSKRLLLLHAIDEVYNYQLLDMTKKVLNNMLNNASIDNIVDYVLEQHSQGLLCVPHNSDAKPTAMQKCSMGFSTADEQ